MQKNKHQPEQNKEEKITSKSYTDPRKELAKLLRIDKRKLLGPKVYRNLFLELDMDIFDWVKNDIEKGYFVEAYTLTDQYVETLLKYAFYGIFKNLSSENLKLRSVLKSLVIFKQIDKDFFDLYTDFKKTRNDLVHNSVFYPHKARELKNTQKIKNIPLKIISEVNKIFDKRKRKVIRELKKLEAGKSDLFLFITLWIKQEKHNNNDQSINTLIDKILKEMNKVF